MARYKSEEYEGLEYLELRKRLKEEIRNKMKRESGTASSSRNIKGSSSKDNFGSFFGPSQPFIAQRVIEESKALLENPDLTAKVMRGSNSNSKPHDSKSVRPNVSTISNAPKVSNGVVIIYMCKFYFILIFPIIHIDQPVSDLQAKAKIQEVRNARDYSFLLSDDAPAPPKPSLPKKVSAPNPDSLRAQSLPRDKNLSSSVRRNISSSHEVRRSLPGDRQLLKPKSVSTSNQSLAAREYKKEPIRSNARSHGQPLAQKNLPLKSSASDLKRPLPNLPRSNSLKPRPPTISKHASVPKKPSQEFSKQKMIQKQPTATSLRPAPAKMQKHVLSKPNGVVQKRVVPSSKPQGKQPAIKNPERRPAKRPMRWDEEDDDDPVLAMRKITGYDPSKYHDDDDDDDDDSNMEATFADIEKEELRSARIARKEDEEELRKIEEEERREQLKRERREQLKRDAKKQKLR
ncbi:hypothetical protein DM860_001520 [Cuscuta australis]|uniref:SPT2 chromatin protein n=1 Tax=Cuscuta australis TaxID=267555 RepID=A0A328E903_9ASTE|nr:hypothetical protein DM860_001520 [Cuscuta australis]